MQRLELLNRIEKRKSTIGIFYGMNRTDNISDAEFEYMQNMSSDCFPAAAPRKPRGEAIKEIKKPNGLFWKNGLAYVDGDTLFYKDEEVGKLSDGEKRMVGMGAYIAIFPDKMVFNTSDGSFESIEETWQQAETATMEPTYDASMYTKITCKGIGEKFKAGDGVTIEGCVEEILNGSKIIQSCEADYIVIIGQLKAEPGENGEIPDISIKQESGITVKRTAPEMDFVCEADNRLWGCSSKNHEIYASKLGDPKNWNCFEGTSTDSYAATVGSDGDFTGCINYMGYVLFFKEECIHKLYGNKPSNIQINTYPFRGVAANCEKSLCVVNETLYYAARNAIMRFDGAMPESASDRLGTLRIDHATAEQYQGKYYVSVTETDGKTALYVFDTMRQMWHREDDTEMQFAEYGEGMLFYISGGELRTIEDSAGSERVAWSAQSGAQFEGNMNRKRISRLQLMVEMEPKTLFEVYVSYDGNPLWERVFTKGETDRCATEICITPRKCNFFKYKIKGKGFFKLYGISKTVQIAGAR